MYTEIKRVLFVCVHNAGRSQMAEAFFNQIAKGKAVATSAGTQPSQLMKSVLWWLRQCAKWV